MTAIAVVTPSSTPELPSTTAVATDLLTGVPRMMPICWLIVVSPVATLLDHVRPVRSPEFARHPVAVGASGTKELLHPEVGDLEVAFEVLTLPQDSGIRVLLYTGEPGSPFAVALQLLRQSDSPTRADEGTFIQCA